LPFSGQTLAGHISAANRARELFKPCNDWWRHVQGVSQLLKQSNWAQIQDFKWYHNDDYIYWKV